MHYIHRFRAETLQKIVGLFVFTTIVVVIALFIFVAQSKKIFEREYQIVTTLDEGHNLGTSTLVKLAGIEVGKINSVQFNRDNKIEVMMKINAKFQEKIREDSIATIAQAGLAGDKYLNISLGTFKFPMISDGGMIVTKEPVEITDVGAKLTTTIEYVESILTNIKGITGNLNSPSGELSKTMRNIEEVTNSIKEGRGSVGSILNDNKKLYEDLNELAGSMKKIMANMEDMSVNMKKTGEIMPVTMKKVDQTVEETNKLVKALQDNWLVSGYFKKQEKQQKKNKN